MQPTQDRASNFVNYLNFDEICASKLHARRHPLFNDAGIRCDRSRARAAPQARAYRVADCASVVAPMPTIALEPLAASASAARPSFARLMQRLGSGHDR